MSVFLLFSCLLVSLVVSDTKCLKAGEACDLNMVNGGCSVNDRLHCQRYNGSILCEHVDHIQGSYNPNLLNCTEIDPSTSVSYCSSHVLITDEDNTQFCSCDKLCVDYDSCCRGWKKCTWHEEECVESSEGGEGSGDDNDEDMVYLGVGIAVVVLLAVICLVLCIRKEKNMYSALEQR